MIKRLKSAIAYLRVSTETQQKRGDGLDLQLIRIQEFARHAGYEIVEIFRDAHTGRGEDTFKNRPGATEAIKLSKEMGYPLLVDGLDRLTRNTAALERLVKAERLGKIISCKSSENGSFAAIMSDAARAQREAELISQRTKQALQERKAQGVRLGNPTNLDEARRAAAAAISQKAVKQTIDLDPLIRAMRAEGRKTADEIAEGLNLHGVPTSRGMTWNGGNVRRLLDRIKKLEAARASEEKAQRYEGNELWGAFS